MREKALEYINRDKLEYIDFLEILRRGSDRLIYAESDGLLLQDTWGCAYMMSAENLEAAGRMLGMIQKPDVMAVHQDFIAEMAAERFGIAVDMKCFQSAWQNGQPPELTACPYPITQLGMEHLDAIDRMYTHGPRGYIAERIECGEIYGCVDGGRLAAFIGTHDEGAMGMLEVAEDYRRLGLGAALFTFMTGRQLGLGRYAFSHIETHNEASLAMHRKYGFGISKGLVYWVK